MTSNEHKDDLGGLAAWENGGGTLLTPAGREAFERAAARKAAKDRLRQAVQEDPGGHVLPPAPPRLQCMTLPGGKFLLVLDGYRTEDGDAIENLHCAAEAAGGGLAIFAERIDVHSWPDQDLAAHAAQACALTHELDDNALLDEVRKAVHGQVAEAEAWREHGRQAVEDVDALRARADRAEDDLSRLRAAAWAMVGVVDDAALALPRTRNAADALRMELERTA